MEAGVASCRQHAGSASTSALYAPPAWSFQAVDIGTGPRLLLLATAAGVGLVLDSAMSGGKLPSVRRQVDPRWLTEFRPHIYGFGFGFQLGLGVATIVTTSAIYLWIAAAVLSGSPGLGAVIGAVFGATRGAALLPSATVRTPTDLGRLSAALARWNPSFRSAALTAQTGLSLIAFVTVLD